MAAVIPKRLREQLRFYESEGFTVSKVERASRHYRVIFNEFPEPQFLTCNSTDWRAYRNNIARYRRLAQAQQESVRKDT